jgi:hypothetical protein
VWSPLTCLSHIHIMNPPGSCTGQHGPAEMSKITPPLPSDIQLASLPPHFQHPNTRPMPPNPTTHSQMKCADGTALQRKHPRAWKAGTAMRSFSCRQWGTLTRRCLTNEPPQITPPPPPWPFPSHNNNFSPHPVQLCAAALAGTAEHPSLRAQVDCTKATSHAASHLFPGRCSHLDNSEEAAERRPNHSVIVTKLKALTVRNSVKAALGVRGRRSSRDLAASLVHQEPETGGQGRRQGRIEDVGRAGESFRGNGELPGLPP